MTHAEGTYIETGGPGMTDSVRRSIPFTIDGQPFTTDDISQRASALLRLAELDPCQLRPRRTHRQGPTRAQALR